MVGVGLMGISLVNRTDLELNMSDFLERDKWTVELRGLEIPIEIVRPLDDHTVVVSWKQRGKYPFAGHYHPGKKLIEVKLRPDNTYPLKWKFPVGTEQVSPIAYRYRTEEVTFNNPNELTRYIYCHEFSHLLDRLQGFSLRMKETKANRFVLKNCGPFGGD